MTSAAAAKGALSVAVSGLNYLSNYSIVVIGDFSDGLLGSSANAEGVNKAVINTAEDKTLSTFFS
ncbi:hypothetical protein ACKE5C_09355 [Aneurinibacillus thermoaerophilus]|uniref:Uncharacterized protein n=1 Tax=Aneurinibacillus thermoaerophilus TaxID=143495 RepID=A0ABX8YFM8_ANETH|nr:hypothetical protein [Aneurinibacillus thermoaerophilus]QYY44331.1 hypothetical protein K3F53_09260 [Aneurinibacillus thermoaerophilus]